MLPEIKHLHFDIEIPSLKKKAKFRPFLAKEEKILLTASAGRDEKDIIYAVESIISNCIQTDIDVKKLASFDLEYIFLKLRAKSVDNIVEIEYEDSEDEKIYPFVIDLNEIEMIEDPNHTKIIEVNDEIKIAMKYPTIDIVKKFEGVTDVSGILDTMIINCIDKIYDDETVYEDYTEEELKVFLDNLSTKTNRDIDNFFKTMPKLYKKLEYTNTKGSARVIELNKLTDFFTFV